MLKEVRAGNLGFFNLGWLGKWVGVWCNFSGLAQECILGLYLAAGVIWCDWG